MRLTIIHPAIGHWFHQLPSARRCLEPLAAAQIAGLTPPDIGLSFYDDRLEDIPFDVPTDGVVIPYDTLRARRAYQIASDYRQRGVPVIFCGTHPTLMPDEAAQYAEAVVQGDLENIWEQLIDDLRHQRLQKHYRNTVPADLSGVRTDRRIFHGKPYLPVSLLETSRGCRFHCEFCATPTISMCTYRVRPAESILREIDSPQSRRKCYLLVDDNFTGCITHTRELLPVLARLNIRWAAQISLNAAYDENLLAQMAASGCCGVHIGFETLDSGNLQSMHKQFNAMRGGYIEALKNLRRQRIAVYGSFIFGYENDTVASFDEVVDFALEQRMFLAAFHLLTPLPGTPLYSRLQSEGRLAHQNWWLQQDLRANQCVFTPKGMSADELGQGCIAAQQRFYRADNLLRRGLAYGNRYDLFIWRHFFLANLHFLRQQNAVRSCPLGDERWQGKLVEASQ